MCLGILERIAIDWNRDAAPIRRLNPLYFNKIDKIDVLGGSLLAGCGRHDLAQLSRRRRLAHCPFCRIEGASPTDRPKRTIQWAAGRGCGSVRFHQNWKTA